MLVLTKFFENEDYRNQFVKGKLYLSSMSEFTKIISERALMAAANAGDSYASELLKKQRNNDQRDIFEGTVACVRPDLLSLIPEDMRQFIVTDVHARAVGYNYSNICCFCKMDYKRIGGGFHWIERKLPGFGNYGVIITDQKEFLARVNFAAEKYGYKFLCGSVSYHPFKYGEKKIVGGNMLHMCMDKEVCIDDLLEIEKYDAFDKWEKFKGQNEWRLVVNKGYKKDEPLRLNIGDLSDIVVQFNQDELKDCMTELFIKGKIKESEDRFYGNVERTEMRDEFYRMGENKALLLHTIGTVEYKD